jgi:hypothetical protein
MTNPAYLSIREISELICSWLLSAFRTPANF